MEVKDKRTKEEIELDEGKVISDYDYFLIRYGLVELHEYYLHDPN